MPIIEFLQSLRSPVLDVIFKSFTYLGSQGFYFLLLPVAYWCWRKKTMQELAFLLLISFALNAFFKNAFALPRPPVAYHLVPAEGYGLPSGHTQGAITLWGFVFLQTSKKWLKSICVILILGIGLSRIYLGVHFPRDVLAGLLIGGVWLAIFYRGKKFIEEKWNFTLPTTVGLFFVMTLIFVFLTPTKFGGTVGGAAFGMLSGLLIENRFVAFDPDSKIPTQIAKVFLGIFGIVLLYLVLKFVFPATLVFRVIRYTLIGAWLGLGAPWLFVKLHLAISSKSESVI